MNARARRYLWVANRLWNLQDFVLATSGWLSYWIGHAAWAMRRKAGE